MRTTPGGRQAIWRALVDVAFELDIPRKPAPHGFVCGCARDRRRGGPRAWRRFDNGLVYGPDGHLYLHKPMGNQMTSIKFVA